jgi:hypothetical protein
MFTELLITQFVEQLKSKDIKIYHACQYIDFCTYLEIGGIPSRGHMEGQGLPFTKFETDASDKEREVWDKVFFNFDDFGKWFAKGKNNMPNPYGPILLVFEPEALLEAQQVALCLRSAGESHFSRENEALKTIEAAAQVFKEWKYKDGNTGGWNVCFKQELEKLFPKYPGPKSPELSCAVDKGYISFAYLLKIVVDPYTLAGANGEKIKLMNKVNASAGDSLSKKVVERNSIINSMRYGLYDLISESILVKVPTLMEISQDESHEKNLRDWALGAIELNWIFQPRFAQYLREGTIIPITQNAQPGEE